MSFQYPKLYENGKDLQDHHFHDVSVSDERLYEFSIGPIREASQKIVCENFHFKNCQFQTVFKLLSGTLYKDCSFVDLKIGMEVEIESHTLMDNVEFSGKPPKRGLRAVKPPRWLRDLTPMHRQVTSRFYETFEGTSINIDFSRSCDIRLVGPFLANLGAYPDDCVLYDFRSVSEIDVGSIQDERLARHIQYEFAQVKDQGENMLLNSHLNKDAVPGLQEAVNRVVEISKSK